MTRVAPRTGIAGSRSAATRRSSNGGPTHRMKPVKSIGRHPRRRTADQLEVNEPQHEVLELVGTEPTSPTTIARTLGRSRSGVSASLYALQDRGLVVRVPSRGWRRT